MANKIPTFGSRIQVYRGHAKKTSGGLTKSDLMMNKHGRVVSKAKHFTAKKEMRLLKHGYGTKKGKFGFVKTGSKSRRSKSRSRKMRGGMHALSPLDLSENAGMTGGSGMAPLSSHGDANWSGDSISGSDITNFGSNSDSVQIRAGMAGGMSKSKARSLRRAKSMGMVLRSKGRGRGSSRAMRGGTTSPRAPLLPMDYNSTDVQMRAGLGN